MSRSLDKQTRKDLFHRLSDRLGGESAITQVAPWLEKHTKHEGKAWSFRRHEFQIAICNDTSRRVSVQKPTQVGLTELSIRIALALCAMRAHFSGIYVFPSALFAGKVSKSRIDPIIESSERLSSLLVAGANSSMMKRIGSSTLYMGGAESKRQAISIPAQALFFDEKDFCNQEVLTAYYGRLGHVHESDQMIREFSTPTVADYGINASILKSTRNRYMAQCEKCATWQAPDFATQVRIPGWDGEDFHEFSKDELLNPKLSIDKAYLACKKCGHDLATALASPKRQWVETHPGRTDVGYEVKPFDLVYVNDVPKLVRAFGDYASEADYWNFRQGEVFQSDTNSVNLEHIRGKFVEPAQLDPHPALAVGLDVGHTYCYLVAGLRVRENGVLKTKCLFRKRLAAADGGFVAQALSLLQDLGATSAVCDIGPDRTLSRAFAESDPGRTWACAYRKDRKEALSYYDLKEDENVVSVQRTKGFNALVKELNEGRWTFSVGPDQDTVVQHLGGMKRIQQSNEEGDMVEQWVKTADGQDHYLHACMYLKVALDMLDQEVAGEVVGVLPSVSGVRLGAPPMASNLWTPSGGGYTDPQSSSFAKLLGIV